MPSPLLRFALPAALSLVLGACAVGSPPAPGRTMPAARAGLPPEYRLFYDALADYGDWVLIEPHGWLFRPTVSYHTWRPYEDGFWVPTDAWGWVWNSAEPFGWATDHYGRWLHDDYQGWVWQPGLQWGPAWVDWSMAGDYVGWRPLGAGAGGGFAADDATTWAPLDRLGSTDVKLHVKRTSDLGAAVAGATAVDNTAVRGGTLIHLGPAIGGIEQASGHALPRSRVEDMVQRGDADAAAVEATRRAAERATREARALTTSGAAAPPRVPVVRPVSAASTPQGERGGERAKKAPADTTRR